LRKRHNNVDINSFLLHDVDRKNYKIDYVKLIEFDENQVENCIYCGNYLTKIDEKVIIEKNEFEQIIEVYECQKCGYLYEFSLKKVTKNH